MSCYSGYDSTSSYALDAFGGLGNGFNGWFNNGFGASFGFGNNYPHSSLLDGYGSCDFGQTNFGYDSLGYLGYGNGFDFDYLKYGFGSNYGFDASTLLNSNNNFQQFPNLNVSSSSFSSSCSFQDFGLGKNALTQPKLQLPNNFSFSNFAAAAAPAPALSQAPVAALPKFSFSSRVDFSKVAELPKLTAPKALAPIPTFSKFPVQRAVTAAAPLANQFDTSFLLQAQPQLQLPAQASFSLPKAPTALPQLSAQPQPAAFLPTQFQFPVQLQQQQAPLQLQQPQTLQQPQALLANNLAFAYPFAYLQAPLVPAAAAPAQTKTRTGKESKPTKSIVQPAKSTAELTRTIKEVPPAKTIKELANVPVADEKTRNLKLIEGIMMACSSNRSRPLAKDGSLDLSDVLDFYEWLREKKRRINLAKLFD